MIEFFIDIENGKIVQKRLIRVKFGKLIDGQYKIKIEKASKRSLKQNAYLHAVLIPEVRKALENQGYRIKDEVEAKQIFKAMFCTHKIENPNENSDLPIIHLVKDTSNMTKKEISELIDEVIQFCAEHLSWQIPYPNEQTRFNYGEDDV